VTVAEGDLGNDELVVESEDTLVGHSEEGVDGLCRRGGAELFDAV
jgi:hypothetical protein